MRANKTVLGIIATALLPALLMLGACLPEPLEIKGVPKIKSQLVISSHIIPDQSLLVFVTRTFGALEANDNSDPELVLDQIAVNDATVTLHYGSSIDTLSLIDKGVYGGIAIEFIPGEIYTLRVESESLGLATATTEALPQVRFTALSGELYFDGFDDTLAQITYSFVDPPEITGI